MATITLKNVRLAFADVFTAVQFQGQGEPRYSAVLLIEPGSENDNLVQETINHVAKEKFKGRAGMLLKQWDGNTGKLCYTDGNLKDPEKYNGFQDKMALAINRPKKAGPISLIGPRKNPATGVFDQLEDDGTLYAGCYVNAKVDIWAQDGTYPGIRGTAVCLQFADDGESFGGTVKASAEGMDELDVDMDDDEDFM